MQADGLVYYRVVEYETDLLIASETDQTDLMQRQVHETRKILEGQCLSSLHRLSRYRFCSVIRQ